MRSPRFEHRAILATCLDAIIIIALSVATLIAVGAGGRFVVGGVRIAVVSVMNPLLIAFGTVAIRALISPRLPLLPACADSRLGARFRSERTRIAEAGQVPRTFKWCAAGVATVTLIAMGPHVRHPRLISDPGDPLFSAWRLAAFEHQLTHDPLHLFDANIFYPARWTLTYSDATVLEGLAAAPFIAAGFDPLLVSNWMFLIAFPLSALSFSYSAWRLTSSLRAGFVAGILGGLYPFHTEHYSHLEMQYFFFAPLAIWALLRMLALPNWRTGGVLGLVVTAQWLASMYFGVMLVTLLLPFALLVSAGWRVPIAPPLFQAVGSAMAIVAIGVAFLAIPYMASRGQRGDRGAVDLMTYSAVPRDYARPHGRLAMYRGVSRRDNRTEREMFPGTVTVALAAMGACPPLGVTQIATIVSGALAFDFSLGINGSSYSTLYKYVLPYRGMRVPARFSAIVGSVLVLLAAFGCRRLFSLPRSRMAQSALFAVVAVLAFVDLRPVTELHRYYEVIPSIYERVTPDMVLAEFPRTRIIDYMYFSTKHWAHLLRGYSGFMPPDDELETAMNAFPSAASLRVLRRRGATHVTYNCAFELSPARCQTTLSLLEERSELQLIASEIWQGTEVRLYRYYQ